jgi:hypothetical protein
LNGQHHYLTALSKSIVVTSENATKTYPRLGFRTFHLGLDDSTSCWPDCIKRYGRLLKIPARILERRQLVCLAKFYTLSIA